MKNVTPSKTKGTGNTGGGNNPQNKTNEKASGSVLKTSYSGVKPNSAKTASATNVGVVSNTNKKAQPINYRVTNAVSFLAAKNLGISTDSTGTPHISNPSDGKKFMEECDRLKKNEDKIIAAAGISVDENGKAKPKNSYEETAYKRAYESMFGDKPTNGEKSSNKIYVSPKGAEVSSGKVYTTKDILNLNGSTVFVVNDGEVEDGENVTVNIDDELADIIMTTSKEFNIDPILIIAVMAHESRFKPNISSDFASGLMQVNDIYFPTYASENKELIESLGGDYTDIYDKAANIVAWGASYSVWVDTYGDNKDSLKALRQGYIQPDNYPDGWSPNADNNANEFMDIKNELDNMIK